MMTGTPMRSYVARYRWPGKKPFHAGTVRVFLNHYASQQEALDAVTEEFESMFADILPDDYPRPKLEELIPGAIFFVPEEVEG